MCCWWRDFDSTMQKFESSALAGDAPDRLYGGGPQVIKISSQTCFEPEPPRELLIARGLLKDERLDLRNGDTSIVQYMEASAKRSSHSAGPAMLTGTRLAASSVPSFRKQS
jgi:hypothetical protein